MVVTIPQSVIWVLLILLVIGSLGILFENRGGRQGWKGMGCGPSKKGGKKGRKFPKAKGKHSKWFFIHRQRGTLKNYRLNGVRKKGAPRKKSQ